MSNKGRRYELDLIGEIFEVSEERLVPVPPGYSGNHRIPSCDFIVNDGRNVHAFEVKRTAKDRYIFDLEDDIKPLIEFCQKYPAPTYPYLAVRFDRRKLIIIKLWMGKNVDWVEVVESGATLAPTGIETKVTRTNNLSVYKPETSDWESAGPGRDSEHVLDIIGFYRPLSVRQYDPPE